MRNKILTVVIVLLLVFFGKIILDAFKFSPVIFQFLFNREISLKKSDHNINLLLLGIPGGKHDGPNLSDTIILASLSPEKNKTTLVSIPRDLWVKELSAKVNKAYAEGEAKKKGGGLVLAKAVIGKITGQPIDYTVRIDFNGFIKAIDEIGGLEIEVENTLDDHEYPIAGKENDPCGHTEEEIVILATSSSQLKAFPCRYEHVYFNQGKQMMNGEQALKFVRSRHAEGAEGTDFARSKRQEKVITAFKDKVLSVPVLLNPITLSNLYNILQGSIDTDVEQEEFDDFLKLAEKMKNTKVQSVVLDIGDYSQKRTGLLIHPAPSEEYENQWVLIPRFGNGNFSEIQKYIDCEIKTGNCTIPKEL